MRTSFIRIACAVGIVGAVAGSQVAPIHRASAAGNVVTFVTDIGGLNDNGFNHLGAVGTQMGATKTGWTYKYIETTSSSDYVKNLTAAARQSQMVIAVGFSFGDALATVAKQYPKVMFTIIDWSYTPSIPNVNGNVFKPGEASYLAGILAAGVSKTGTVGFVGGLNVPVIQEFAGGFKAGALSYNPKIKVLISYTGSFTDQSKGKTSGLQEISQGADVVYAAAGASGLGTLAAADQRHVFSIGVDSDQNYLHTKTVLTSVVKHVEVAIAQSIVDAAAGKFKAGTNLWNLKNNGVGLAAYHGLAAMVPTKVQTAINIAKMGIIGGKVVVPTKP